MDSYVSKIDFMGKTLIIKDENAQKSVEETNKKLEELSVDTDKKIEDFKTEVSEDNIAFQKAVDSSLLEKTPTNLKNAKILMIGDSFLRGSGGIVGRGWGYYLQQNTGCEAIIHQNSGGGFIATGGSNSEYPGKTFVDIITQISDEMSEDERNQITHIVVAGGWNDGITDVYNESNLFNAIGTFCAICKQKYNNAIVHIIPLKGVEVCSTQERARAYDNWVNEAMAQGVHTCVESIDWFTGRESYSPGDGVHLNDGGYSLCGKYLASLLYGTVNSYQPNTNGTLVLQNGVTVPSGQRFRVKRFKNLVTMQGGLSVPASAFSPGTQLAAIDKMFMPWGNTEVMCHSSSGSWVPIGFGSDSGIYISNYAKSELLPDEQCTVYITATFAVGN